MRGTVTVLPTLVALANAVVRLDKEGGYSGIVVALHSSVTEDPLLLANLQELFTKTSDFLHLATEGRMHFKEVTIAVPPSWEAKQEYVPAAGDLFQAAEVRIDRPHPAYGQAPYTLQPGGCGQPGTYIHLTPAFVTGMHNRTLELFGPPERQLVHEWAHLRYGVYDEYGIPGDPNFPMFYLEDGRVRPTSCVKSVKGWIENVSGGPCKILGDGTVGQDCIFIPDLSSEDVKASIMYMPFIPSIEGFCHEKGDLAHNPRAPTKHNTICNYQSTWSVISRHPDFSKVRRRPRRVSEVHPKFRVVRRSEEMARGRIVLVLDVSASMAGRPMKLLHRAASRLVADRLPDGTHLGLVQFSTSATALANLTVVGPDTRSQLLAALPRTDNGGTTAIGKGLLAALQVLGNATQGALVVVVTDGEENVPPFIPSVLSALQSAGVTVNTVAFGAEASGRLEALTRATGGRGFYFPVEEASMGLDLAFLESATSQSDLDLQPVTVVEDKFEVTAGVTHQSMHLDPQLGGRTVLTFTSPDIHLLQVELASPAGRAVRPDSPYYSIDLEDRERIEISLPEAEAGRWEVKLHSAGPASVGWTATSEPRDTREQPVRVKSWLGDLDIKFPTVARVYAQVSQGYQPILGARVLATVDRPMGGSVDLELRDNGAGADVTKHDGIYSAFFTHFNGNGRYAVVARVLNDGRARLKVGGGQPGSRGPVLDRLRRNHAEPSAEDFALERFVQGPSGPSPTAEVTEPAEVFQRSVCSGAFRLEDFPDQTPDDIFPPASVTDLSVTAVEGSLVTLRWTSPGDDLDTGQVLRVELRWSQDPDKLLARFNSCALVEKADLAEGNLDPPPPAGQPHEVVIKLPGSPEQVRTVYFAVVGVDDCGLRSLSFSIFPVNLGSLAVVVPGRLLWRPLAWKVGLGTFLAVVLIAAALGVVYQHRRIASYRAVATTAA